jgi:hypothetical protein
MPHMKKDMKLFEHLHTVWKFSPLEASSSSPCCEVQDLILFATVTLKRVTPNSAAKTERKEIC